MRSTDAARRPAGTVRVLALGSYYPPMVSGAGAYLAGVCEGQVASGGEATVLVAGSERATFVRNGVRVEALSAKRRGMTSLLVIGRALRLHRAVGFDVVVAGFAYPAGIVGAVVAGITGRPLVTLAMGEELTAARRSRPARWCLSQVFRRSAHTVAISRHSMRMVLRFGGDGNRTSVVTPAVDPAPFVDADAAARQRFRTRLGLDDRTVVLTAVRLEERKGHDVVIEAVAQLIGERPDLHYLIVGEGDQTRLLALARRHGVAEHVTIVEYLEQVDYPAAFAAADIFVMVSRANARGEEDGFGIVYLEAAAAGLPCVAGTVGGCPEAIDAGVTGLCVDPHDPQAVADAMRTLLVDPERARAMGAAGRARVLAAHTHATQAEAFRTLLARVHREHAG